MSVELLGVLLTRELLVLCDQTSFASLGSVSSASLQLHGIQQVHMYRFLDMCCFGSSWYPVRADLCVCLKLAQSASQSFILAKSAFSLSLLAQSASQSFIFWQSLLAVSHSGMFACLSRNVMDLLIGPESVGQLDQAVQISLRNDISQGSFFKRAPLMCH